MLHITFKSTSDEFEQATRQYQAIWSEGRESIIKAFKEVTGLEFKQKEIEALVYEGPSSSGKLNIPMKLRASYSHEVKQGTLVHELGHRLIGPMKNRIEGVDEHRTLNLFLYDVWMRLYGKEFADRMVVIESDRRNIYDYEGAWKWFLTLSIEEKSSMWDSFITLNTQ